MHAGVDPETDCSIHLLLLQKLLFEEFVSGDCFEATAHGWTNKTTHCP